MRRLQRARGALVPAVLLMLAGCGGGTDTAAERQPAVTAAELGEQTVLGVEEYLASPPYAEADLERGRTLYLQCRACHTMEKGGRNLAGPNLHGTFGKQAAAEPDFPYSDALRGRFRMDAPGDGCLDHQPLAVPAG